MGTLEKILNILKMKNEPKSYSVKFYAEKKLDDGRVIATEDEQFTVGSKVFAVSEGEAKPLEAGTYTLEDGDKLVIGDSSNILELGETEVTEDEKVEVEASTEEELAEESEAEETDWAKTFEEIKDRVAELEKAVFGDKAEEETEELSEEVSEEKSKEDKTEMSSEVISDLMTEVEELKSKIAELSSEPATESINYNPEGEQFSSTIDLRSNVNLSAQDKARELINNYK